MNNKYKYYLNFDDVNIFEKSKYQKSYNSR